MEASNRIVCGMVLGEASESDDESDASASPTPIRNSFLPSNNIKRSPKHKLKYNTLLHYKLSRYHTKKFWIQFKFCISFAGESNISLRNNVVNIVEHPIQEACQHLKDSLHLQTKTRASLHEMPRYFHQLSVALVGLQDRLPTVCNVNLLPDTRK